MDRPVPIPIENRKFHIQAALVYAAFLAFSSIGLRRASIVMPFAGTLLIVVAILAPLPAYWHQKHRSDRREAVLALFWVLAFGFTLPFVVYVCARLGMPLQDLNLARLDHMLGVNVPAIAAWTDRHPFAQIVSDTYPLLVYYFLPAAILLPVLFGRWMAAREFLIANVIGVILGLTAFAFLPAVGPWYGYHVPPDIGQAFCQSQLLTMRTPGPYIAQEAGVVCFPSFHVIWAILCARALSTFRTIRIPACVFAGMIVLSTVTTGWHYFVDVLGGIAIAHISIAIASRIVESQSRPACAAATAQVARAATVIAFPSLGTVGE